MERIGTLAGNAATPSRQKSAVAVQGRLAACISQLREVNARFYETINRLGVGLPPSGIEKDRDNKTGMSGFLPEAHEQLSHLERLVNDINAKLDAIDQEF